jgi:UDP-N-acetylmuramoyl-tripeptide--D-alanyl-D-alanine ligase
VEIGTNHPGEIRTLCRILDPTHGLETNVGREHLEFFRTVRRVAAEEGALYSYLRRSGSGTALINADDPWVLSGARGISKTWKYGFNGANLKVKGNVIAIDSLGRVRFRFARRGAKRGTTISMSVPGMHNAMNALAAATTGLAFGVPPAKIQKTLAGFGAVKERMQVTTSGGVVILNDTYNANPDSVLAALRTLASMKSSGKKIVVLGDMRELGKASELEHRNIGREVEKCGFEYLLTYGEQAKHINKSAGVDSKFHYDEKNTLAEYLLELVAPGDVVLVKGSRGMKMEDVVIFLQVRLNSRNGVVRPQEQPET